MKNRWFPLLLVVAFLLLILGLLIPTRVAGPAPAVRSVSSSSPHHAESVWLLPGPRLKVDELVIPPLLSPEEALALLPLGPELLSPAQQRRINEDQETAYRFFIEHNPEEIDFSQYALFLVENNRFTEARAIIAQSKERFPNGKESTLVQNELDHWDGTLSESQMLQKRALLLQKMAAQHFADLPPGDPLQLPQGGPEPLLGFLPNPMEQQKQVDFLLSRAGYTGGNTPPLEPEDEYVRLNIGQDYVLRGYVEEAREQYKRILEDYPDAPAPAAAYVLTYIREGRLDEAIQAMTEREERMPSIASRAEWVLLHEMVADRVTARPADWTRAASDMESLLSMYQMRRFPQRDLAVLNLEGDFIPGKLAP